MSAFLPWFWVKSAPSFLDGHRGRNLLCPCPCSGFAVLQRLGKRRGQIISLWCSRCDRINICICVKPSNGFRCSQGFCIPLGLGLCWADGGCNETTEIPLFDPFFTGTLWKAFSWEGVMVADVSQAPSQLAVSRVLEAWPLWAEESKMIHLLTILWVYLHS